VAGASLVAAWRDTTPLIVLAGLALFVAALDAVEPLSQEVDHPDRTSSMPVDLGDLQARQIAPSVAVMLGVCAVAAGVALAISRDPAIVLPVAGITLLPAAVMAAAAGAMSVVKGPPSLSGSGSVFLPPEAAGMRLVFRLIWPPALVVISLLPVLAARSSFGHHNPVAGGATSAAFPIAMVAGLAVAWLRFHEQIHEAISEATGGGLDG
jgi:hypothetical protein